MGWSRMSGRKASGTSRPSLGAQVLAVFSFISYGESQFKKCLGKGLAVPDILLPDIRVLLKAFAAKLGVFVMFRWMLVAIAWAWPNARPFLAIRVCGKLPLGVGYDENIGRSRRRAEYGFGE